MAHEELAMASRLQRTYLVISLAFLLRVVAAELEKPAPGATINRTVSLVFGLSQQQSAGNTSDKYAAPVREPKALKMDSYQNLNITTSTDHPVSLAVHLASANKSDNRLSAKTTSSPRTVTGKNRRSTPHRKYSNHHYSAGHSEDKRKIYVTNEDYSEQQYQNYQQDYHVPHTPEYEDPYSTIPVLEQNLAGYEGVVPEFYREPYPATDPGYFGPPIAGRPVYDEPPHGVHERGCHCPENRQMSCDNSSADFIALVGALGSNLWALIQLIATSSLPFIIPLLFIKLILVPIGIIKFLALIKIFFKLFIILPFFVRHIYPAFTQSFNLHDLIFQKIQDAASHVHNHDIPQPHDQDIESRTNFNATSILRHEAYNSTVNDTKIWDLRGCPTRVACELGAFLSSSTYVNFPQKLANYLSKRVEQVEAKGKSDGSTDDNQVDYEDEDEKQDQVEQQDQAFKAFIIALGKKWTQEQCQIYSCSVLF